MASRRKKPPLDIRIVRAQARKEKAQELWERNYARLRRAVKAMEKADRTIKAANKTIERVTVEVEASE